MTRQELITVVETLLRSCGTKTERTVNPADPTVMVTYECKVFMEYGIEQPGDTAVHEYDVGPAAPQVVTVKYVEFFGDREIAISIDDGHGYAVKFSQQGKVTSRKPKEAIDVLTRLVNEGDWSGKTPEGWWRHQSGGTRYLKADSDGSFEFQGKTYTWKSGLTDPAEYADVERWVEIYGPDGEQVGSNCEQAGALTQIDWWKASIEEQAQLAAEYAAEEAEVEAYNAAEERKFYASGQYCLYLYYPAIGTGRWEKVKNADSEAECLSYYHTTLRGLPKVREDGLSTARVYNPEGEKVWDNAVWHCPQCGEPCSQKDGIHEGCKQEFAQSDKEDDHDGIGTMFAEMGGEGGGEQGS